MSVGRSAGPRHNVFEKSMQMMISQNVAASLAKVIIPEALESASSFFVVHVSNEASQLVFAHVSLEFVRC